MALVDCWCSFISMCARACGLYFVICYDTHTRTPGLLFASAIYTQFIPTRQFATFLVNLTSSYLRFNSRNCPFMS